MGPRIGMSGEWRTRAMLACALTTGSFILAHTINGVVAYSLENAGEQAPASRPAQAETAMAASEEYRQEIVRSILVSGLFPVPPPPQDPKSSAQQAAAAVQVPLNLAAKVSLLGIVRGGQPSERAILEELSTKQQGLYRVSDRIPGVGELAAIERDRVLFREGGQEEWIQLAIAKDHMIAEPSGSPPVTNARPIRRVVDRTQLVQLVSTPETYLSEARFQPHFNVSGQPDGIRIDGIRQAGVLEKAGFENQDVLAGINGVEVRDPGRVWDLFQRLQQERIMRFNVVRQSQPFSWAVEVRG